VTTALVLAALVAAAAPEAPRAAEEPASTKARSEAALVAGELPDDPARPLLQASCLACHSADYVTQQRLTEKQWQAEVAKMRRFGTPLSDEEAARLAGYLARSWTIDLPERRPDPVPAPKGSLPAR
jgi:phage tail sheath gpL-like